MAVFNKILFILLVASLQQIKTADLCPAEWVSWGSHCYRFELNDGHKLTWTEAEAQCVAWGQQSHLASIQSATEQEFIYGFFEHRMEDSGDSPSGGPGGANTGPSSGENWWEPTLYIGLLVGNTKSDLSWSDASAVNYVNWFDGEPNNFPHSAGQISAGTFVEGRWVDAENPNDPGHADYFVCKMPQ